MCRAEPPYGACGGAGTDRAKSSPCRSNLCGPWRVPTFAQSWHQQDPPPVFPIRDSVIRTREPVVVWTIIGLNVAGFLYQLTLTAPELQAFLLQHALVPRRYFFPAWGARVGLPAADLTPFLTNTFLHGGWLHIIVNLWTLYIFGPALEDRLGPARFAILYLLAGVIASVAHALFNASSAVPALGASGAIAGVIAAYAVRFPWAWVQVLVLVIIIPLFFWVPALLFAGLWFLTQVLQGTMELFTPALGGGIAWWAHIGGFITGLLAIGLLEPKREPMRYGGPWGTPSR
jgi:membrane associated rhomboid family serine protease